MARNPKKIIEDRIADYLKATWYARWIIVAVVAASCFVIPQPHLALVIVVLASASAYNILLIISQHLGWRFLSNRTFLLVVDNVAAVTLIVLTGGSHSPYHVILIFMIISSAYWFGSLIAIIVALLQMAVVFAIYDIAHTITYSDLAPIYVRTALFVTLGMYMAWLTKSERAERHKLLSVTTQTEQERQQLLSLINTMTEGVLVVDHHGNIGLHNQAAIRLAKKVDSLYGKPVNDMLQFTDRSSQSIHFNLHHLSSALDRRDLQLKVADGSIIDVALSVAPYIVDRQNRGFVMVMRDITRDRTIEEEREEFIAVASHELRTPLTIAEGSISTALQPDYRPKNAETIEMLSTGLRSLQQLSHIVSDLTTLSQAANERLQVELEVVDLNQLFSELRADYSAEIESKGITLAVRVAGGLVPVLSSRYMVREILTVLINNAIKFTDKGGITLSARPAEDNQGVVLKVTDTGIGISASDQQRLFEKFFQSEDYHTRNYGGIGLGLYIARKLASRLTAKLWCESQLGKGSTFCLQLPLYSKHRQDQVNVAKAETKDFFGTI